MKKNRVISVQGTEVTIATRHEQDFISLTDMVRNFEGGSALIEQWLKNKDTVLFLGVWEQLNNPGFNSLEFEGIRNEAGRNSFFLSAKKWAETTHAFGLHAKAGRYGGTYAHRDIAFEFGSGLSPEFKLYLIKEFQRLKDEESRATALEWSFQRTSATLEDNLTHQRRQRELVGRRSKLRRELFNRQDEVEAQRNELIQQLELKLQQQVEEKTLFTIEWALH